MIVETLISAFIGTIVGNWVFSEFFSKSNTIEICLHKRDDITPELVETEHEDENK